MFRAEGLEQMRTSLAADGYTIEAREVGERLLVQIEATPEACADCLAPPPLMRQILGKALGVEAEVIDLRYPETPGTS